MLSLQLYEDLSLLLLCRLACLLLCLQSQALYTKVQSAVMTELNIRKGNTTQAQLAVLDTGGRHHDTEGSALHEKCIQNTASTAFALTIKKHMAAGGQPKSGIIGSNNLRQRCAGRSILAVGAKVTFFSQTGCFLCLLALFLELLLCLLCLFRLRSLYSRAKSISKNSACTSLMLSYHDNCLVACLLPRSTKPV